MVYWQRQVTNTLVEEKRHLSKEIKILTSRVCFLKHEKEQEISELKRVKKKLMNERKHRKEISSFILRFFFCFFVGVDYTNEGYVTFKLFCKNQCYVLVIRVCN